MSVSVALRPTPTTSTLDRFVIKDPPTVKQARNISKVRRSHQWKRVVRQRARPQRNRSRNIAAVKRAAGPHCKDICGTRAIAAKTTNTLVAATTNNQSSPLREGL